MEMAKERICFTFDPKDMLLSLQIESSCVGDVVACAILERNSVFDLSSETIAPRYSRYLKLVTESAVLIM